MKDFQLKNLIKSEQEVLKEASFDAAQKKVKKDYDSLHKELTKTLSNLVSGIKDHKDSFNADKKEYGTYNDRYISDLNMVKEGVDNLVYHIRTAKIK
jgi:hypothetical protein